MTSHKKDIDMEKHTKISLKDIAKATGFSLSTVSRAINDRGYVQLDKKRIIIAKAKQKGYFKNLLSNVLLFSQIVILMPTRLMPNNQQGISTFYRDILENLQHEADRLKLHADVSLFNDANPLKSSISANIFRDTDGVIAIGFNESHLEALTKLTKKPIILINSQTYSTDFNVISPDNRSISYQCTKHLINNGHRNILYTTAENRTTLRDRILGFKDALFDNNIEYHDYNILTDIDLIHTSEHEIIENRILKTIKDYNITAIFGYRDFTSLVILKLLKKHGFSIPDDISIISINNETSAKYSYPPLTSYELPKKEMAIHAIHSLIYQQVLLAKTHLKIQLYGKLMERASVKNISNLE